MKRYVANTENAFSLVELLTAMSISVVLVAMMTHMIGTVTHMTVSQKQSMDSLGETRSALDRISLDWAARVRRSDVWMTGTGNFISQSTNGPSTSGTALTSGSNMFGNDTIRFLSQVPAFDGTRKLAVVGYRINPSSHTLERGVLGYNVKKTDPLTNPSHINPVLEFYPPSTTAPGSETSIPIGMLPGFATAPDVTTVPDIPNSSDFEQLSGNIFRIEFCYLRKTITSGTVTSVLSVIPPAPFSTDLIGVVVTIATLDENSRKILSNDQMVSLTKALPDAAEGDDTQSKWITTINKPGFAATAGIPITASSAVRVYQRILLNIE